MSVTQEKHCLKANRYTLLILFKQNKSTKQADLRLLVLALSNVAMCQNLHPVSMCLMVAFLVLPSRTNGKKRDWDVSQTQGGNQMAFIT